MIQVLDPFVDSSFHRVIIWKAATKANNSQDGNWPGTWEVKISQTRRERFSMKAVYTERFVIKVPYLLHDSTKDTATASRMAFAWI